MSDAQPNSTDGLDPKREDAIVALLNHTSVRDAAKALGIHEKTLYRWLGEPAFAAAYRKARRLAFAQAISLSQRYTPMAVQTLAKISTDQSAPHAARVSASTALLKFSRESIELDDLAERVEALEAELKERGDA